MSKERAHNDEEFDIFIGGEQLRTQMTEQGLVKDRRKNLRKHRQCFVCREAVDWAVKLFHAGNRQEAVASMNVLVKHGIIHHVSDEQDFKDTNNFFRFTRDDDTYLANPKLVAFYKGVELYRRLKKSGSNVLREMYVKGEAFPESFHGCDVLDFCCMRGSERSDAIASLTDLMDHGVIRHVSGGQQFLDDRLIYEFRLDFNKPCILVDVLGVGVTDVKGQGDQGVMDVASLASGISSTSINSEDTPERLEKREIRHRWQDKQKEQQRSSNKAYLEEKERRKITFDEEALSSQMESKLARLKALSKQPHQVHSGLRARTASRLVASDLAEDSSTPHIKYCVQVTRDGQGFGLVLSGNSPAYVLRIDPLGPASRAGVKVHQLVSHVDEVDVTRHDHSYVAGLLTSRDHVKLTLLTNTGTGRRPNA